MNKKKIFYILMIILGMSLISYPIISNYINMYKQTIKISNYQEDILKIPEDEKQKELANAQNYNNQLEQSTAIDISLNNNENLINTEYINVLNLDEVMGYISIPKINVYFPIYHGTSKNVLQSGVGHLEKTSLPIGGKNTHAVLAGHSGLSRVKIFDDLNKLNIGDKFYIHILNNMLSYQVDKIDVILPDNTDAIKTEENKDYVTLVTCTPRILNTHRLLVRGSRIEENISNIENKNINTITDINEQSTLNIEEIKNNSKNKIFLSSTLLLALSIFILILILGSESKKENEKKS